MGTAGAPATPCAARVWPLIDCASATSLPRPWRPSHASFLARPNSASAHTQQVACVASSATVPRKLPA
eukprot:3918648-Prymnesium_polylepis.3